MKERKFSKNGLFALLLVLALLSSLAAPAYAANAVLKSLSITMTQTSIGAGVTVPAKVTGTYSDGSTSDLTLQCSWSSSDKKIATVTPAGTLTGYSSYSGSMLVTGISTGNAIISVTYDSLSASKDVKITTVEPILTNDPLFHSTQTENFEAMKVTESWQLLPPAKDNVIVAVLDCGFDINHPDLKDNLLPGYDAGDNDYDVTNNPSDNGYGHGTSTAGIIAAVTNNVIGLAGAAKNCKILPIKVISTNPLTVNTTSPVAKGIRYAVDHGAKVISMSFGYYGDGNEDEKAALDYAHSNGVTLVAAGGNEEVQGVIFPAKYKHVICVEGVRADFSRSIYNYGEDVDVSAIDGGRCLVPTDVGSYDDEGGSSISCPFVAALAAEMLVANPNLTPDQIESYIEAGCKDLGDPGRDIYFGFGIVDYYKAVYSAKMHQIGSISISPSPISMFKGDHLQLGVNALYLDGSIANVVAAGSCSWYSSNPSVASVTDNRGTTGVGTVPCAICGMLNANSLGTATITATYGGFAASTTVTIDDLKIVRLEAAPSSITFANKGDKVALTVNAIYNTGKSETCTSGCTFTSSNLGIAKVANRSSVVSVGSLAAGTVTGVAKGKATITATYGGASVSVPVVVCPLKSLAVIPSSIATSPGVSTNIKVTGTYSDGSTADVTSECSFSSTDKTLATAVLTSKGAVITGVAYGKTIVTITDGSVTSSIPVTVIPKSFGWLEVTPSFDAIEIGYTRSVTIKGVTFDGASFDITGLCSYSASDPSSVSASLVNGVVNITGKKDGYSVITVTYGSNTLAFSVIATNFHSASIKLKTASIQVGSTMQAYLRVYRVDGSACGDMNYGIVWSSANPKIAKIDDYGKITGLSKGQTTVSGTYGGYLTATTTITVS